MNERELEDFICDHPAVLGPGTQIQEQAVFLWGPGAVFAQADGRE